MVEVVVDVDVLYPPHAAKTRQSRAGETTESILAREVDGPCEDKIGEGVPADGFRFFEGMGRGGVFLGK